MPTGTPAQKVMRTMKFGNGFVKIVLEGNNFDEAYAAAQNYAMQNKATMVPPFDNEEIIAGQGTVALEIKKQFERNFSQYGKLDAVIVPIGGGGLISGVATYLDGTGIKVYGVEAEGAAGMHASLKAGKLVTLDNIDTTVDGMAVKTPGRITYDIVSRLVGYENTFVIPEGAICKELIDYYHHEGDVVELAGVASIAALNYIPNLESKNVACIISGGNMDFSRAHLIERKSLEHQKLFASLTIYMPNTPGQGKKFFEMLDPETNVINFNLNEGPVEAELHFQNAAAYDSLISKLDSMKEWSYTIEKG